MKSEFLSVMSHEVRTPLNAVLGMAQLLETTELDAQQRAWLGHLQHGGETLLAMVSDILDLASIEAGRLHLHPEPTDLGAVVREVADLHSALALAKRLLLQVTVDPDLPRAAWVDRHRLRQVLGNLLSNAIKFTAQGRVQVDAALQADGAGWTLTVSDTGPGIPEAFRPHLYEPFRQGTEGTARRWVGQRTGPGHRAPAAARHGRKHHLRVPARPRDHLRGVAAAAGAAHRAADSPSSDRNYCFRIANPLRYSPSGKHSVVG